MKHKISIHQVNGKIVHISTSGETEIYLIEKRIGKDVCSKLEPDYEFEVGKGHEAFMGESRQFLKKHEV